MNCQSSVRRHAIARSKSNERRGAVLVAALVCLLVVMGMLGAMLRGTLRAHRQLHRERDLCQTELLLQAASDRARHRLANEPDYRGETWELPAETIVEKGAGRVTIEILPPDDQSTHKAQLVAEYPLGGETSIRRSRTFQIQTHKPSKQE